MTGTSTISTTSKGLPHMTDLDGRIAQGWGGLAPNGVHVNVVLAHRGSPTAASLLGVFTQPRPGFTPILATVGPDQPSYETVLPPVVVMNKTAPESDFAAGLVSGAAQLGAAQGALDAAAAGDVPASDDVLVFVALWIDGNADDETAVRLATREAVGTAVHEAATGRDADAAARLVAERDHLQNPFYAGS
jgi:formaldehyde-activating enzyme